MSERAKPLLPQHSRYDFVPLVERKDYSWPQGRRLAFCLTTNVEWFAFGAGLGHDPAKAGEPQTQRNYAWRDYGNRIGVWRLLELCDELGLPAAHNTNSLVYDYAPQVMAAIRKRGDEVVAHGRTNAENLTGSGVDGGTPRRIAKGDWVMVPEKTPHWFTQIDGTIVLMSIHLPHAPATTASRWGESSSGRILPV